MHACNSSSFLYKVGGRKTNGMLSDAVKACIDHMSIPALLKDVKENGRAELRAVDARAAASAGQSTAKAGQAAVAADGNPGGLSQVVYPAEGV